MAILTCLKPAETNEVSPLWLSFSIVNLLYFFSLFLYSIIPIFLYYRQFRPLPPLNRWTRIGISIALGTESLGHAISIVVGLTVPSTNTLAMYLSGICLLEFPSYVTATCYSVLLLFWLSVCAQILPIQYTRLFKIMRIVLLVFNVVAYILLIVVIALNSEPHDTGTFLWELQSKLNGFSSLARDLMLVVILLIFVIHLKFGIGADSQAGATIDERILRWFSGLLAFALLIRGLVSLFQGLFFQDGSNDCAFVFWVMAMLQEIVFEGGPFFVLIRTNTNYLVEQERYADKTKPLMVSSSASSGPSMRKDKARVTYR
jgi:hypothetical protein